MLTKSLIMRFITITQWLKKFEGRLHYKIATNTRSLQPGDHECVEENFELSNLKHCST